MPEMPNNAPDKEAPRRKPAGGPPGGPMGHMRPMEKAKLSKDRLKSLKRLFSYITSEYLGRLMLVLLFVLLSACASTAGSLFLRTLIDDYITPLLQMTNPVFTGLLKAITIMAFIYLIGIATNFLSNWLMVTITQGVQNNIRNEMFNHMQKLTIKYFDTHSHGDIMSYYTNDTDTLRQLISQSIPQLFSSVITIVVVFISMVTMNFWMTMLVLAFVVLMLLITGKVAGNSSKYFVKQQSSLGDIDGFIEEMINGQKVVKVFCYEDKSKEKFDELNDELCENATKANVFANILMPILGNLGNIQYVIIALVGGALAISGEGGLTLGIIVAFLQLSRSFTMPITQVSQQVNSIVMALAGAERIFSLLDEEPEQDSGYVTLVNAKFADGEITETKERTGVWAWKHPHGDGTITYTQLMGDVLLENVDFAYDPEKPVLNDVSVFAAPGQKIAFVGATGAGKTTITNLINRFYDIADGKIRYDGININKIRKSDLRRSLGMVLQDVTLFTGSVWENIRYGRLDATDEEVIAAARHANAHGFIKKLSEGYDTILSGDGSGLSQGQRQLLAIARCALCDPPVMILDEATSSIDTRTEAIVQRGMDQLMHGRTVFVIAHRLSTVQNSDVIMVLELGKIIERGNHEKLIAQKGKYYQLYTGAFELE